MPLSASTVFGAFTNTRSLELFVAQDMGGIPEGTVCDINCTESSFFIAKYTNKPRRTLIRIMYSSWFGGLVLFVILLNSVFLLLDDPALNDIAWLQSMLNIADYIFLGFFAIEMIIKMLALGLFLHKKSYFRDLWNLVDFMVVASGFATIGSAAGGGVSALRVIRVLRPLRTVARVQSLRHILTRLMNSLPRMADVCILLAFVTWMFAIVGIQFFPGVLHQRCYANTQGIYNVTGDAWINFTANPNVTGNMSSAVSLASSAPVWTLIENDTQVCAIPEKTVLGGHMCDAATNGILLPQRCMIDQSQFSTEILNYDNLFYSMLLTFKVVCRDNWPDDLNNMHDATGPLVFLYHFSATMFAGYFCVNLFVAVLTNTFSKKDDDEDVDFDSIKEVNFAAILGAECVRDPVVVLSYLKAHKSIREGAREDEDEMLDGNGSFVGGGTYGERDGDEPYGLHVSTAGGGGGRRGSVASKSEESSKGGFMSDSSSDSDSSDDDSETGSQEGASGYQRSVKTTQHKKPLPPLLKKINKFFRIKGVTAVGNFVRGKPYTLTVLAMVFLNSIILSFDRYPATEWLVDFINWSSLVFTILFLLDAAIKLVGLGPSYFRSPSNVADFVLCVVSIPGLAEGSSSPFTALRAFRLIRLLKLAKNWENLQNLLKLVVLSLKSVASLSLVALIVIYIYAILGFQLFRTGMPGQRFSFAEVFDSFLAVFVIITGENWAGMMQSIMLSKGQWSVLYFITLVFFGNFILTNLFIAIILENFGGAGDEAKEEEDDERAEEGISNTRMPPTSRTNFVGGRTGGGNARTIYDREELAVVSSDDDDEEMQMMGVGLSRNSPRGSTVVPDGRRGSLMLPHSGDAATVDATSPPTSPLAATKAGAGAGATAASAAGGQPQGSLPFGLEDLDSPRAEKAKKHAIAQARVVEELSSNLQAESGTEQEILGEFIREQDVSKIHIVGDESSLIRASEAELRKLEVEQNIHFTTQRKMKLALDVIGKLRQAMKDTTRNNKQKNAPSGLGLADHKAHNYRTTAEKEAADQQWIGLTHSAWGCIAPEHPLRRGIGKVLRHRAMEALLVFLTLASSLFIALDRPSLTNDSPELAATIYWTDIGFAALFSLEVLVKCFALGPIGHEGSYFRSIWNWTDFIVAATSVLALFFSSFKIGRVLRVLRLTNLSFNLKVIVTSLASAVPGMGSVMVLCGLLWWVYAVLGIALFKGRFYFCNDPDAKSRQECIGLFNETVDGAFGPVINYNVTREWNRIRDTSTFDSIEAALYSLLKLSLSDGWFDIMYWGVDSVGIEQAQRKNASPFSCLYFITFMIFGNFFIVNLFIGVLVDRFVKHRAKGAGMDLISESQKQWILAQKVIFRSTIDVVPRQPKGQLRALAFKIVSKPLFDHFFFGIIILNSVILSMYIYDPPQEYSDFLYWCSLAIIILFTIEAILKITALGKLYFVDGWNRLDFVIVILSWIGFGIGSGADVVRIFRVARLFLLVRKMKGLQTLFITLWQAVPELLNVGVVLAVAYFIFAFIGVELFSHIKKSGPLNALINFDDVGHAFVTLYQATTTEGWADIADALRDPPDCTPYVDCGTEAAIPYFVIFMIVMAFVLMNLLVTVVIDSFSEAETVEGQDAAFAVLDLFKQKWTRWDTTARQRLHVSVVLKILPTMPNSVWDRSGMAARGRNRQTPWQCVLRQCAKLHIPIDHEGNVLYADCVASLAMRLFCVSVEQAVSTSQRTPYGVTWKGNKFSVHHQVAAKLVTHSVRRWLVTRRERELEGQLRQLRDQHAVVIESEIEPLRQSHHETTILARWLLQRLAIEREEGAATLVENQQLHQHQQVRGSEQSEQNNTLGARQVTDVDQMSIGSAGQTNTNLMFGFAPSGPSGNAKPTTRRRAISVKDRAVQPVGFTRPTNAMAAAGVVGSLNPQQRHQQQTSAGAEIATISADPFHVFGQQMQGGGQTTQDLAEQSVLPAGTNFDPETMQYTAGGGAGAGSGMAGRGSHPTIQLEPESGGSDSESDSDSYSSSYSSSYDSSSSGSASCDTTSKLSGTQRYP